MKKLAISLLALGLMQAGAARAQDITIALVGHEPALSALLAHLLGMHQGDDRFAFKKGGAALVHLPDGPSVPGRLIWFVKPRILRSLAAR